MCPVNLQYAISPAHGRGCSQDEVKLAYYAVSPTHERGGSQDEVKLAYE